MCIIVGGEGSLIRIAMCCRNGSEASTENNVGSELLLCVVEVEREEDRKSDGAVVRAQRSGEKDCLFSGGIECWYSLCGC